MRPLRRVGVVVPAHEEAELLPACLRSVREAARRCPLPVEVVVAVDACSDATSEVAREGGARTVELAARSAGAARRAAAAALLADGASGEWWLASTDADSLVPPHWLEAQLALAERGADAVVGSVHVRAWEDRPAHVARLWLAAHEPREGHRHVHGANLGVRGDAYLRAGAFPPLTSGEDVALVRALEASGARVVRTAVAPVETSARRRARAPFGFAAHLDALELGSAG